MNNVSLLNIKGLSDSYLSTNLTFINTSLIIDEKKHGAISPLIALDSSLSLLGNLNIDGLWIEEVVFYQWMNDIDKHNAFIFDYPLTINADNTTSKVATPKVEIKNLVMKEVQCNDCKEDMNYFYFYTGEMTLSSIDIDGVNNQ